jgi:hypothetical protein
MLKEALKVGKSIENNMIGNVLSVNQNTCDELTYFQKLIPFVEENFITLGNWESGDYRPALNIWQIPKGETPMQCINSYSKIITLIEEFFEKNDEYDFDIEDDFTGSERLLPINMLNSFRIKIFQKGDILEVIPNYSIINLMKVAVDLLKYLENSRNS